MRRNDDGPEVAVHAFHTVLKHEIANKRPQVGDELAVKYLGIPDGKSYEAYRVLVEKKEQTPVNYDAMEPRPKQQCPTTLSGWNPDDEPTWDPDEEPPEESF